MSVAEIQAKLGFAGYLIFERRTKIRNISLIQNPLVYAFSSIDAPFSYCISIFFSRLISFPNLDSRLAYILNFDHLVNSEYRIVMYAITFKSLDPWSAVLPQALGPRLLATSSANCFAYENQIVPSPTFLLWAIIKSSSQSLLYGSAM